ncbi:esterase/lipase family protein [Mycobacterium sp. PDNC021]|uniref:esterase/lipase family protein n=1 Tax=Mycobacterium sp. PDNC021 TaxID=3391399 RepID=UPI003AABDB15
MVNTQEQPFFARIPFDEANMNLHRHCGDYRARRLIVFVHGLSGKGYGTWGKFPQYIFDDQPGAPVDVAVFDHFSGLRRRIRTRPSARVSAQILTERLQELSRDFEYDEIFLVAHSMGGLISMDALRHYLDQRNEEPGLLRTLAGAIFIATPLNGSKLAHAAVRPLASEWKLLRPSSEYQHELRKFIDTTIDTTNNAQLAQTRHKLPIWAIVGGFDLIVSRKSSTFGIDPDQIRTAVTKGHMCITKPRTPNSQVLRWVRGIVDGISSMRADIRDAEEKAKYAAMPRPPSDLVLVEFLLEMDADDSWRRMYHALLRSAGTPRVQVKDRVAANLRFVPNLLVSAHRTVDLLARREKTKLKVQEIRRRYDATDVHARAIAVGPQRESARDVLSEMSGITHQDNRQHLFILGAADDDDELEVRLKDYVSEIVENQHDILSQLDEGSGLGGPWQIGMGPH